MSSKLVGARPCLFGTILPIKFTSQIYQYFYWLEIVTDQITTPPSNGTDSTNMSVQAQTTNLRILFSPIFSPILRNVSYDSFFTAHN
jgi:hypothetical protein